MKIEDYQIDEHIHRFAVWTAARAASRSRLKNTEVEYLVEQTGLKIEVEKLSRDKTLTDASYRAWLKQTCEAFCRLVTEKNWEYKSDYFCVGIAAKIISIYIKTVEVLPTRGTSLLSSIAYPPIDSILLKNLNTRHQLKMKITWSKFKWPEYEEKIMVINRLYPSIPKWKIEVEWKVSNEEDTLIANPAVISTLAP